MQWHINCAFCDINTKFSTHVDDYMTNKFGYGGILDLTFDDLYVRSYVRNKLNFLLQKVLLIKKYIQVGCLMKGLIARSCMNLESHLYLLLFQSYSYFS